ncbi:chemotaxis sensor histidine kinase CheA [Oleiphilus messinensis]|uniref:Chemotaxis protein CheA n=2 Tax=Oleiphilus messinensis TaxID=141451 RepID=A0A1Y0I9S4_9GAMM|nr:chemotaxis sensor histidine kinase CheA [Oleiphilus messinensis]
MEDALLRLDSGEYDSDVLNEIFRSAHTIKGSAGIFGLDHIVEFTHVVENILDRARDDEIRLEEELLNIIFKCRDHIAELINHDLEAFNDSPNLAQTGKQLLDGLIPWFKSNDADIHEKKIVDKVGLETEGATGDWHLSLRLSKDCLRNGMDPISFLNYLSSIGELRQIITLEDSLPDIEEFDAETLYLGYEISLQSNSSREEIENTFTFVREDSEIRIIPPNSTIEEYIALIEALPEDDKRIGEILVGCGAISSETLCKALQVQENETKSSNQSRKIGEVLVESSGLPEKVVNAAAEKQEDTKERKKPSSQLIRIDADRLDHLINLIGELVINRQRVNLLAGETRHESLIEAVGDLENFTEQLRDAALNLRMVQIGSTFQKFKRIVRDTAQELGKDINLILEGTETELDRLMVEKLGDPLTHIIRNAIDHGIEAKEQRLANGKSETGTIKMAAFHEAGSIVIEVSDDGGGIAPEKIRAKAVIKEIISEDANLSDQELLHLVFHPGFSTAESVTNLSGRGVGMDVVKRNVEALQGTIDINSKVGFGTRFQIRLPLTLAIIDGFHVQSGNTHFIVPQSSVVECTDLGSHEKMENRNCINVRGEMIPFIKLGDVFKISPSEGETASYLYREGKSASSHTENLVIARYGEFTAGIVADQLHGEIQTVVKPLGPIFKPLRGIGGSTLLGNGEIAFILDIPQLIESVISNEGTTFTVNE